MIVIVSDNPESSYNLMSCRSLEVRLVCWNTLGWTNEWIQFIFACHELLFVLNAWTYLNKPLKSTSCKETMKYLPTGYFIFVKNVSYLSTYYFKMFYSICMRIKNMLTNVCVYSTFQHHDSWNKRKTDMLPWPVSDGTHTSTILPQWFMFRIDESHYSIVSHQVSFHDNVVVPHKKRGTIYSFFQPFWPSTIS